MKLCADRSRHLTYRNERDEPRELARRGRYLNPSLGASSENPKASRLGTSNDELERVAARPHSGDELEP